MPALSRRKALVAGAATAAGVAAGATAAPDIPGGDRWLVDRAAAAMALHRDMNLWCGRHSAAEEAGDEDAMEALDIERDEMWDRYAAILTEMSKVPAATDVGLAAKVSFLGHIEYFGGAPTEAAVLESAGADARRMLAARI